MDLALDPLLALTLRLGICLLFAAALVHKLQSFYDFEGTIAKYLQGFGLRRSGWERPVAGAVILVEAITVVVCSWHSWSVAAALLSAMVLLSYAAAMGINLARGHTLPDCGCSWGKAPQPVAAGLVARNITLAGVALLIAVPTTGRTIGVLDILSALFALIVSAIIYAAINQLMALTEPKGEGAL